VKSSRQRLNDAYKEAMKARDAAPSSTQLRMVLASAKDRDICARPAEIPPASANPEIVDMRHKMVNRSGEASSSTKQGTAPNWCSRRREIAVIGTLHAKQLDEGEAAAAVEAVLSETGAASLKTWARVMALLKERFSGRLDLARPARW